MEDYEDYGQAKASTTASSSNKENAAKSKDTYFTAPVEPELPTLTSYLLLPGTQKPMCYVCLDNSKKHLTIITKKLINKLRSFDLYVLENSVTPIYMCDACRIDINDSCQMLDRLRDARNFWVTYSEKMGVAVRKLAPVKVRKRIVAIEMADEREERKKKTPQYVAKFYRCQMCLEKFHNQFSLMLHQWDVHIKNKEQPEICPDCDRSFIDSDKCRRHYQRMHLDAELICDVCGKSGMTKPQMKFHLKAYHNMTMRAAGLVSRDFKVPSIIAIEAKVEDIVTEVHPSKPEQVEMDTTDQNDHFDDGDDDSQDPDYEPLAQQSDEAAEPESKKRRSYKNLPPPIPTPNGFDSTTAKKCPTCNEWFPASAETNYYLHVWLNHAKQSEAPNKCRECEREFAHEDLCRRHYFANHFEQNCTCNLCYKTGMTNVQYKFHIKYCTKKKMEELRAAADEPQVSIICTYCPETFPDTEKVKLFNHIWKTHIRSSNSPTICSLCQKDCFTENNCRAHFYNMHYDNNYLCRICDKSGFTKNGLKEHRLSVHSQSIEKTKQWRQGTNVIAKQQCDFCGEWFRITTDEWTKHIWTQHGRNNDAPEQCVECNKTYSNEFFAQKHFFGHHYRKVEICDVCGKGNMTRRELVTHKKNHDLTKSKKQIQCQLCARVLNSDQSYERHLVFHKNQKHDRTHNCQVSFPKPLEDYKIILAINFSFAASHTQPNKVYAFTLAAST